MALKSAFLKGSGWGAFGTGVDNLVQFLVFVVLARLLSIEDIGLVAFVIVVIDFGRIVVYGGYPEALIRRATWDDHVASVCFTLNMILSILFALALAAIGPLASRYFQAESANVMAALAAIFVIDALRAVHVAKLRREHQFKSLAFRSTWAGAASGAGAIALAYAGAGVWALVFQRVAFALIMTAATWRSARFTPRLTLSMTVLRELSAFSIRTTISRFIDIGSMRATDLLVGAFLGPVTLGYYRVASRSLEALMRLVIRPFQDAAFTVLSKVPEPAGIGRALIRLTKAIALVTFPIFFGAAALSGPLLVIIYGPRFGESGLIMSALALGGPPATIVLFVSAAMLAAGAAQKALRNSVAGLVAAVVCSLAFLPFGAEAAAFGNCLAQYVTFAYICRASSAELHLPLAEMLRAVAPPFLAAAVMAAGVYALRETTLGHLSSLPSIAILVPAGALFYAGLLALFGRKYLASVIDELASIAPRRVKPLLQRSVAILR